MYKSTYSLVLRAPYRTIDGYLGTRGTININNTRDSVSWTGTVPVSTASGTRHPYPPPGIRCSVRRGAILRCSCIPLRVNLFFLLFPSRLLSLLTQITLPLHQFTALYSTRVRAFILRVWGEHCSPSFPRCLALNRAYTHATTALSAINWFLLKKEKYAKLSQRSWDSNSGTNAINSGF